jgi:ribosomal protein L1
VKHGKKYRNARAEIDREQVYSPVEAVRMIKGAELARFDESVEAHFNLGLNVRHAEQQLRGTKMPNPKTGTVTMDLAKAVRDAKAGKLEYRTDRGANVHVTIGKKSFDERQLVENYAALIEEIMRAKPAAAKGRYIKTVTLTSTMGPGIHVDPARTRGIVEELEGAQPEEEAVPA